MPKGGANRRFASDGRKTADGTARPDDRITPGDAGYSYLENESGLGLRLSDLPPDRDVEAGAEGTYDPAPRRVLQPTDFLWHGP